MQRWTDLGHAATTLDRVKLAVFVSTLGTMAAALGGGLDKRTVARHLALFSDPRLGPRPRLGAPPRGRSLQGV